MTKRYEDLSDDELHTLAADIDGQLDTLSEDDEAAIELIEQETLVGRELSRRNALSARKAGRYSVTMDVNGEMHELELNATNQADAEAEAKSGAEAMSRVSGQKVTVKQINAPLA